MPFLTHSRSQSVTISARNRFRRSLKVFGARGIAVGALAVSLIALSIVFGGALLGMYVLYRRAISAKT